MPFSSHKRHSMPQSPLRFLGSVPIQTHFAVLEHAPILLHSCLLYSRHSGCQPVHYTLTKCVWMSGGDSKQLRHLFRPHEYTQQIQCGLLGIGREKRKQSLYTRRIWPESSSKLILSSLSCIKIVLFFCHYSALSNFLYTPHHPERFLFLSLSSHISPLNAEAVKCL